VFLIQWSGPKRFDRVRSEGTHWRLESRVGGRGIAPGVTEVRGEGEVGSSQGGDCGPERSGVGPFREPVQGHVWRKGKDREVAGAAQAKEGTMHVLLDGVWEGSVRVGETDHDGIIDGGGCRTGEGET
jgi:hypothetical protein